VQSKLFDGAVLLNSGRACFEYVLRSSPRPIECVYMPKYTCEVMFEPLKKLAIPYKLYEVDENLEIVETIQPKSNEMIVYTNYFGLKDDYSRGLSGQYGKQLIVDCSQALYTKPFDNSHTFYSPRKFFGLPDGGILYTNQRLDEELPLDDSTERVSHLIRRLDVSPEAGYEDFKRSEAALKGQSVKRMSNLTRQLLDLVDLESVRHIRAANFAFLHRHLGATNSLVINFDKDSAPLCYPYRSSSTDLRRRLIAENIFVPTYWPSILASDSGIEYQLANSIIPLPLDQRYGEQDMKRIVEVVHG
jgi:hypothetical protein